MRHVHADGIVSVAIWWTWQGHCTFIYKSCDREQEPNKIQPDKNPSISRSYELPPLGRGTTGNRWLLEKENQIFFFRPFAPESLPKHTQAELSTKWTKYVLKTSTWRWGEIVARIRREMGRKIGSKHIIYMDEIFSNKFHVFIFLRIFK